MLLDPNAGRDRTPNRGDGLRVGGTDDNVEKPPLDGDDGKSWGKRPIRPGLGGRRGSNISLNQIEQIVPDDKIDTETYGVSELREGFFDALFLEPSHINASELREKAKETLPENFETTSFSSPKHLLARQAHELRSLVFRVFTTRSGVRLLKAFVAFFIAYVLCLIPASRRWLGRYSYIIVVSVILNHPSRAIGSQLDGTILTSLGTASGLGWGVVALLLSTSTLSAQAGFGGVLAAFLALFMAGIAWIRSHFVRLYQATMCAGIAIVFTALAETSSRSIEWDKIESFAIPWVLGQAIALVVNCVVFPDAGARPLAYTIHQFFDITQDALEIPRPQERAVRRRLTRSYVDLSTAYRDMRLDLTITRFRPDDFGDLRNLMQAVIRVFLSMETETFLFNQEGEEGMIAITLNAPTSPMSEDSQQRRTSASHRSVQYEDASLGVVKILSGPTRDVIDCMREALRRSDAALMDLSGYRKHLGPPAGLSSDIGPIQVRLKTTLAALDNVESHLLNSGELPSSSIQDSDVVQLFVFARHIREAADAVQKLLEKVEYMQGISDWPHLYLPSYPIWKSLHRANRQVRHDRGGITAGSYHSTFSEIAKLLDKIKSRQHRSSPRTRPNSAAPSRASSPEPPLDPQANVEKSHPTMDVEGDGDTQSTKTGKGYKVWRVLRQLQGFECRYAFKVVLVTSLLSVPSYLKGRDWWDEYDMWWAVAVSWIMIHPRVGGNVQDLLTRAFAAFLGGLWAAAAFEAGDGNPYVLAAFATVYMIPMLYRYTQSSHPRSGQVGCLSFVVISLSLRNHPEHNSFTVSAMIKSIAFLIGTVVPVVVNWVLWPFVARHELRNALSSMMFFMSIIYRTVVSQYVYFEEGNEPTPDVIKHSEMLEGRLREGFVRIRQLLILTRHEIRLREPFDPLPYSALADSCEQFFVHLIALRQSAIFYNPNFVRDNPLAAEKLMGSRRDAVAAVLGNLYIFAGALRSQRKVPRYLPNAAAARKKLITRTMEVEEQMMASGDLKDVKERKKWADIYSYSYNESLTGCVTQLEEIEQYTKLIVGEQVFGDSKEEDDDDEYAT